MLDTGNTVAMIHSTPTQIADFLSELISLSLSPNQRCWSYRIGCDPP